ncbi:hypothetical protein [Pseudomonas sp. PA-6-1D]|uniref:hypothetical protein n=1 Tax=Pseudomonas sp. PA-6-1D TaxID=2665481 RepID=UPI001F41BA85|nr:hypothetical protein [Pseudomonas sp. PA-6-1D]
MVEMATIRNRGEYQWEAQIRRKGYPAQRKTFETKADAQAWARMIESEIDRGILSLGSRLNALPFINSLIDTFPRSHRNTKARIRKPNVWKRSSVIRWRHASLPPSPLQILHATATSA